MMFGVSLPIGSHLASTSERKNDESSLWPYSAAAATPRYVGSGRDKRLLKYLRPCYPELPGLMWRPHGDSNPGRIRERDANSSRSVYWHLRHSCIYRLFVHRCLPLYAIMFPYRSVRRDYAFGRLVTKTRARTLSREARTLLATPCRGPILGIPTGSGYVDRSLSWP